MKYVRLGQTAAKAQAMKDITAECGEGNVYERNYCIIEFLVRRHTKRDENEFKRV